jgi:hypothetical protein
MIDEPIKTIAHKGYTIKIDYDPSPESPREWDNLGILYSNSRRYNFDGHDIEELIQDVGGDLYDSVIPWDKIAKKYYFLKVWMYDHGGVAVRTGDSNPWGIGWMAWDSGLLGVIAVKKTDACKEYGYKRACKSVQERAEKCLEHEIEALNTFVSGEIYGYTVEDESGEEVDSCWGFYDIDEAVNEAKGYIDYDYELRFGKPLFAECEA